MVPFSLDVIHAAATCNMLTPSQWFIQLADNGRGCWRREAIPAATRGR